MTRTAIALTSRSASRTTVSYMDLADQKSTGALVTPPMIARTDPRLYSAHSAASAQPDISAPMRWVGANSNGGAVVGVAASSAVIGAVEVLMHRSMAKGTERVALLRVLTTRQVRRLAQHLSEAADEAERAENLLLAANA